MASSLEALTEKEKQTLRLIVRGHDAKSAARHLGLSVHTVNERLRDARRKLAVSSSREAARRLLAHEGGAPDSLGDTQLGEAAPAVSGEQDAGRPRSAVRIAAGVLVMSLVVALLALVAQPHMLASDAAPAVAEASDAQAEAAARSWLALVDQGRWADSWAQTGASFRSLNTTEVWAAASEKARAPLGAMHSRTLLSQDDVPAPPSGYRMVKFRTDFANRKGVVETVSLDREGDSWRVVGIYLS